MRLGCQRHKSLKRKQRRKNDKKLDIPIRGNDKHVTIHLQILPIPTTYIQSHGSGDETGEKPFHNGPWLDVWHKGRFLASEFVQEVFCLWFFKGKKMEKEREREISTNPHHIMNGYARIDALIYQFSLSLSLSLSLSFHLRPPAPSTLCFRKEQEAKPPSS